MGGVFLCSIGWRPLSKLLCTVTFVMATLFLYCLISKVRSINELSS
jgi:hypothetical protein